MSFLKLILPSITSTTTSECTFSCGPGKHFLLIGTSFFSIFISCITSRPFRHNLRGKGQISRGTRQATNHHRPIMDKRTQNGQIENTGQYCKHHIKSTRVVKKKTTYHLNVGYHIIRVKRDFIIGSSLVIIQCYGSDTLCLVLLRNVNKLQIISLFHLNYSEPPSNHHMLYMG
jgi:hypothetical protein